MFYQYSKKFICSLVLCSLFVGLLMPIVSASAVTVEKACDTGDWKWSSILSFDKVWDKVKRQVNCWFDSWGITTAIKSIGLPEIALSPKPENPHTWAILDKSPFDDFTLRQTVPSGGGELTLKGRDNFSGPEDNWATKFKGFFTSSLLQNSSTWGALGNNFFGPFNTLISGKWQEGTDICQYDFLLVANGTATDNNSNKITFTNDEVKTVKAACSAYMVFQAAKGFLTPGILKPLNTVSTAEKNQDIIDRVRSKDSALADKLKRLFGGQSSMNPLQLIKKVITGLSAFPQLPYKDAEKKIKPKTLDICEFKIPSLQSGDNLDINERIRVRQACGELGLIQKAAEQEAFYAKQIYINTDPLSNCSFIRNCRTQCQLSIGDVNIDFNIVDALLAILGGDVSQLKNAYQKAIDLANSLQYAYSLTVGAINSLNGLLDTTTKITSGFYDLLSVIQNGSFKRGLSPQAWEKIIDNFGGFLTNKTKGLIRTTETETELVKVAEAFEKSGITINSPEWKRLTTVYTNFLGNLEQMNSLQGDTLDFKDGELEKMDNKIVELMDFINKKDGNLSPDVRSRDTARISTDRTINHNTWLSYDDYYNIGKELANIQKKINELRGIDKYIWVCRPINDCTWERKLWTGQPKNRSLVTLDAPQAGNQQIAEPMAVGIYGAKLKLRMPPEDSAFLPTRFRAYKTVIENVLSSQAIAKYMLIDGSEDLSIQGIQHETASLQNAAQNTTGGYFDNGKYLKECNDGNYSSPSCSVGSSGGICHGGSLSSCNSWCYSTEMYCYTDETYCRNECSGVQDRSDCYSACWEFCLNDAWDACRFGSYARGDGCDDKCASQYSCSSSACYYACGTGRLVCQDFCRDECQKNCAARACNPSTCLDLQLDQRDAQNFQNQFRGLVGNINQLASDVQSKYLGTDACPINFTEQDFVNGVPAGGFLNEMACIVKYRPYFFKETRAFLAILEKVDYIDQQIVIIRDSLNEMNPLLEVPQRKNTAVIEPTSDLEKALGTTFGKVGTIFDPESPFDYINNLYEKINTSAGKAVSLINSLQQDMTNLINVADPSNKQKYTVFQNCLFNKNAVGDNCGILTTIKDDFIGNSKVAAFSSLLHKVNYSQINLNNKNIPLALDQIDLRILEAVFRSYKKDNKTITMPSWFAGLMIASGKLREAQWAFQDIYSTKRTMIHGETGSVIDDFSYWVGWISKYWLSLNKEGEMKKPINTIKAGLWAPIAVSAYNSIAEDASQLAQDTYFLKGNMDFARSAIEKAEEFSEALNTISIENPLQGVDISDIEMPDGLKDYFKEQDFQEIAKFIQRTNWNDVIRELGNTLKKQEIIGLKNELSENSLGYKAINKWIDAFKDNLGIDIGDANIVNKLTEQKINLKELILDSDKFNFNQMVSLRDVFVANNTSPATVMPSLVIGKDGTITFYADETNYNVQKVMNAFAIIIGIKSFWTSVWGTLGTSIPITIGNHTITTIPGGSGRKDLLKQYDKLSQEWGGVKNAWQAANDKRKEFEKALDNPSSVSTLSSENKSWWDKIKDLGDVIVINWDPMKDIQCKSGQAIGANRSQATKEQMAEGIEGGRVCPSVDHFSKIISDQFSLIQQSLKKLEIIRRAETPIQDIILQRDVSRNIGTTAPQEQCLQNCDSTSSITFDIGQQLRDILKIPVAADSTSSRFVYAVAQYTADKARFLWALNSAMDYANQHCSCGWSYCNIPICISELPLTPEGMTNPYCLLVYAMRGWMWRNSRALEANLQNTVFDFDFFQKNGFLKEEIEFEELANLFGNEVTKNLTPNK